MARERRQCPETDAPQSDRRQLPRQAWPANLTQAGWSRHTAPRAATVRVPLAPPTPHTMMPTSRPPVDFAHATPPRVGVRATRGVSAFCAVSASARRARGAFSTSRQRGRLSPHAAIWIAKMETPPAPRHGLASLDGGFLEEGMPRGEVRRGRAASRACSRRPSTAASAPRRARETKLTGEHPAAEPCRDALRATCARTAVEPVGARSDDAIADGDARNVAARGDDLAGRIGAGISGAANGAPNRGTRVAGRDG